MWWEPEPVQTTIEQSVPLHEVTFVVVDLETTGGSPAEGAITEIGAVKVRAGEVVGEFQTLVDPQQPIPPYVAQLTGIDDRVVAGMPTIAQVLPSYLEFARGAVFVAARSSTRASSATTAHPCRRRWCAPPSWRGGSCGPTSRTSGSRRSPGTSARGCSHRTGPSPTRGRRPRS